jgi:hypothetical protein
MLGQASAIGAPDEHKFECSCLKFKQKFKFKSFKDYCNKIHYLIFIQGAGWRMINIMFI